MRPIALNLLCLIAGLMALASSGCKQFDLDVSLEDSLEKIGIEEKAKVPDRMVCVWIDDIRYKPGKAAMRGFGGRIMFYDKKSKEPVKVDGSLSVYIFDDKDDSPTESIPLKEFRTPKNVLPLHYSKSDIGHSYSFFLDWDQVGGPQKVLTLIVRFEDTSGKIVVSDAARQTLTGVQQTAAGTIINRTNKSLNVQDLTQEVRQHFNQRQQQQPALLQEPSNTSGVIPASYEEATPQIQAARLQHNPSTTMQTDTITLPPSFTKKLINSEPQETPSPENNRPIRSSAGSWNTSVSYERPTGFAQRGNDTAQPQKVQIANLGHLENGGVVISNDQATTSTTTTDAAPASRFGQSSNRFLSSKHQALRERLRQPNVDPAPSQPVQ